MKSGRNKDFQAKRGEMAGLTGKNERESGSEKPIVDLLVVVIVLLIVFQSFNRDQCCR